MTATPSVPTPRSKSSRWWTILAVVAVLLGLAAYTLVTTQIAAMRTFSIPSDGMAPTLLRGDYILADMRYYVFHRPLTGDVIVFRRDGTYWVKRIIAADGGTVYGKDRLVFVDGHQLAEPYIQHRGSIDDSANGYFSNFGPVSISPGKFFVMGDNRDFSYDSRRPEVGLVDASEIIGKAMYIYWPSSRMGRKIQ
jgi:signal peptidase I